MNTFLITALTVSGLIDLAAGIWILLSPQDFAQRGLGVTHSSDPALWIVLFVLGLASVGLSALHALAIHWLRREKEEGYALSIALGGALAVAGAGTFLYAELRLTGIQNAAYLLPIDALRGVLLGVVAIVARNAPATLRELRLPSQRERMPERRRRGAAVSDRDTRRRPTRPRDREEGRSRRSGGRGSTSRSSRSRRDALPSRGVSDRETREPRREIVSSTASPAGTDRRNLTEPPRTRRHPREESPREGRERGAPRPPRESIPPETDDARSLGIVVKGEPLRRRPLAVPDRSDSARRERTEPEAEDLSLPRPPVVPRLQTESTGGRPLRPQADGEGRGSAVEEGAGARRRRRHRRRPSPAESADRGPTSSAAGRSGESRRREETIENGPEPPGNRFVERRPDRRGTEPRPAEDLGRLDDRSEPFDLPQPVEGMEPIDRLSAFGPSKSNGGGRADSAEGFGHHRRPFSPHRKGRQVKPRGQKVHQSLGGGSAPTEPEEPTEPAPVPRRAPKEGRIGMTDGIGPVDLDDPGGSDGA